MLDVMVNNSDVADILIRALDGERLTVDDGVRLFESEDMFAIGAAANEIRGRINGKLTRYVVNRHINYTDICANRCRFCAFSRSEGGPDAYAMTVDEVVAKAASEWEQMKFTELHIVGGLHPTLPLSYYTDMLSELKRRFSSVHIQAFTAVEIAHIADMAQMSARDALVKLREAGLGSIPGGGAEVFSPRVRSIICPEKMPGSEWLDVMRTAHGLGIKSNCTMLYGHVETYRERVEHMVALRELQDETKTPPFPPLGKGGRGGCGGFMSFIPLRFHAKNTELGDLAAALSAQDHLKVYAISRLMLDNIGHIKVFWIMLGPKLAQVGLSFGADDFDGTVVEEKITHRAGATTPMGLTVPEIKRLIEETGTIAVERDTLYNEVTRNEHSGCWGEPGGCWGGISNPAPASTKLGCLPYLNVRPLVYTLERACPERRRRSGLPEGWELTYAPPSELARMLAAGEIAAAPVSSFACFLNTDLEICPDICIAADGPVRSVLLLSRVPVGRIERVALDTSSLSGAAMIRIILQEAHGLRPEFVRFRMQDPLAPIPPHADAALLIGDPAMLCPKDGLVVLDVGVEWKNLTGLPAVFAVWAGRQMTGGLISLLREAKRVGLGLLPEIAREESARLGLSYEACHEYLAEVISYDMGERERESLEVFRQKAAAHGLLEREAVRR